MLTAATPDSVYSCPMFSVRRVKEDSGAYRLEFEDDNSLIDYIDQAEEESMYQIDADLENTAGVLTLSICTVWHSQRLIVQALLPPVQYYSAGFTESKCIRRFLSPRGFAPGARLGFTEPSPVCQYL